MEIAIKNIGRISAEDQGHRICLDQQYASGLEALEGFSHVIVFWYADRLEGMDPPAMVLDKPYINGPDHIGVFATRSPFRPNNICCSTARILQIDHAKGVIEVDWLDALEGTPVLDLKPYHPSEDRIRDATVPLWCSHWPTCREESGCFNWEAEFMF